MASNVGNTSQLDWTTESSIYSDKAGSVWDKYVKGRPMPPQSYFDRIFQYHENHGGEFKLAVDMGAGGGQLSRFLADRFEKVAVTDPEAGNIDFAKKMLGSNPQLSFHVAKAEDPTVQAPSSVDLIFANVMLHWTDVPKALEAFHTQLKSGGTLAAGVYSNPKFFDSKIQQLYDDTMDAIVGFAVSQVTPEQKERFLKLADVEDSGYDFVELPADRFRVETIQRVKINVFGDDENAFLLAPGISKSVGIKYQSNIKPEETVIRIDEDRRWYFEKTYDDIVDSLNSYPLPKPQQLVGPYLEALKKAMDELQGGKAKGYFPVALVLAQTL